MGGLGKKTNWKVGAVGGGGGEAVPAPSAWGRDGSSSRKVCVCSLESLLSSLALALKRKFGMGYSKASWSACRNMLCETNMLNM